MQIDFGWEAEERDSRYKTKSLNTKLSFLSKS